MDITIFILIILGASVLQASTGFGFSVLATPFLLLLFEPREAIQVNIILSLAISFIMAAKIKKEVDVTLAKRLAIGSSAGVPLGLLIFMYADISKMKMTVAIILLLLTVLLMMNFRLKKTNKKDLAAGGLSGLLTSSIGMPGPPILLYFSGTDIPKETLRATTLTYYLYIYGISLVLQLAVAGTSAGVWVSASIALPVLLLGLYLGQLLFKIINQRTFRLITYAILIVTGVYLLFDTGM